MKQLLIIGALFPFIAFATSTSTPVSTSKLSPNPPWETVEGPHYNVSIERMSVPHGWLVITYYGHGARTTFVPDEHHEWTL